MFSIQIQSFEHIHRIQSEDEEILIRFSDFQFLLATYGLIWCRDKWKKNVDFHFLGLFMNQQHDLSKKKYNVCHAPMKLPLPFEKNSHHLQPRL
jgi:hypothetical protein